MKIDKTTVNIPLLEALKADESVIDFVRRNKLEGLPLDFEEISKLHPSFSILKHSIDLLNDDGTRKDREYDDQGRITKIPESGGVVRCEYDDDGNPTRKMFEYSDELGTVETYEYDEDDKLTRHSITKKINDVTTSIEYRYEYDENGRKKKVTFPDGRTTEIIYDERGNWIEEISSDGEWRKREYDEEGRLILEEAYVSNMKVKHEYRYASDKIFVQVTSNGGSSFYVYGPDGKIMLSAGFDGFNYFEYNEYGPTLTVKIDKGISELSIETNEYDLNGNVIKQVRPDGSVSITKTDFYDNGQLKLYNGVELPKIENE